MIKNKEEFKNYNIVCINDKEIKECFDLLEKLGFNVEKPEQLKKHEIIIKYYSLCNIFITSVGCYKDYKNISFYNFKKEAKKILKEEENKLEDFEFASDGRIIKVNNWKSGKRVFLIYRYDDIVDDFSQSFLEICIKLGLAYATEEARDKAQFKLEIETKLKNIAERLNGKEKIDWENKNQIKYYIYYDFKEKTLDFDYNICHKQQGCIYCLSEDFFLEEAKKEIGEENLIEYFKGE